MGGWFARQSHMQQTVLYWWTARDCIAACVMLVRHLGSTVCKTWVVGRMSLRSPCVMTACETLDFSKLKFDANVICHEGWRWALLLSWQIKPQRQEASSHSSVLKWSRWAQAAWWQETKGWLKSPVACAQSRFARWWGKHMAAEAVKRKRSSLLLKSEATGMHVVMYADKIDHDP